MLSLRFLVLFIVVGGLSASLHLYFYRRLVRDVTVSPAWRRRGKALLIALYSVMFLGPLLVPIEDNGLTRALSAAAWTWLGMVVLIATVLLALELVQLGARPLLRQREQAPGPGAAPASPALSLDRRHFLARTVAGSAVAVSGGLVGYGVWRAYAPPEVTELSVALPRLPKALDGLTIVQVSDIHVSTLIQRRFMDDMVQRCNALKPDLMAVTGDVMDGAVKDLGEHVGALRNLKSRYGSYFCTGNHEYYSGDVEWCAALEKMGLTVLRNRHVTVGEPGASFDVVGVDDWIGRDGRKYDLDKAIAGRSPDRAAVLLAHQPRNFEGAADKGMGLQLSGHVHGGQFFPGTLLIPLLWTQPAGHYTHGASHLYVSRGTGFWGPPMRVGAAPEIVKLVLRAV